MTKEELKECREAFEDFVENGGATIELNWEVYGKPEYMEDNRIRDAWIAFYAAWDRCIAPEWKPIETAPIGERVSAFEFEDGVSFVLFDGESMNTAPSHWMPLPSAPKREANE